MHKESFYPIWYVKEKRELMNRAVRVIFLICISILIGVGYFTLRNYTEYRKLCNKGNNSMESNIRHKESDGNSIKVINKIIFINDLLVENSLDLRSLEFVDNRLNCKIEEKEGADLEKVIENLEGRQDIDLIELSFISENNINLILSME